MTLSLIFFIPNGMVMANQSTSFLRLEFLCIFKHRCTGACNCPNINPTKSIRLEDYKMTTMKKRIPMFLLALAMMVAMAVPAFAATARAVPSNTLTLFPSANNHGVLTVATYGNAGNNDPVYAWSEMTDGNQSTVVSQMWIVQNNAKGLIVKPASNQSLSLNVYRSGNWPCTVYSISDNSYEDYILNSPSYGNNLCQFRLTYRNNYALTASNTSAPQKFSRGSGYIATWTSSSGANSQKWYYTTPN